MWVAIVAGMAMGAAAAPEAPNYAEHVAPIVHEHCVPCHRPGEVAPFPLTSHAEVSKRARQIARVTRSGFMPPWKPAAGYGRFKDERRLSEAQIATLSNWARVGAPVGDPDRVPPLPEFTDGWQLGQPDLVVRMERPFVVPAAGPDLYRNFVIPLHELAGRYVRGLEFREPNRHLIHHATILADDTGTARQQAALDDMPGYEGMEDGGPPGGHFFGWTPGKRATLLEEGMAWEVAPDTDLVVQLHMLPSGREQSLQPEIGIHLADSPPTKHPVIAHLGATTLDIPAGVGEYRVTDAFELPIEVDAHAIYPHAHYLCREAKVWADLPDDVEVPLLWIRDWDFDWQDEYRFAEPLSLPAGSMLRMEYVYDNSARNPRNPHDPPRRARWGPRSSDEMADVWIKVLPRRPEQAATLRAAVGRRTLELFEQGFARRIADEPADFEAHSRLGQLMLAQRRLDEALTHFEKALALEPDSWHAHYNAGVTLIRRGELARAAGHLGLAVRLEPSYVPAQVNLGTARMMAGSLEPAARSYRKALELQPGYYQAHVNLGVLLARQGRIEQAVDHYRRAVELKSDLPEAHNNLASALLRLDRLGDAAHHGEQALKLRPDYLEAHKNMGTIRLRQGDQALALRHFRMALKIDPSDEDSRRQLAAILSERAGP